MDELFVLAALALLAIPVLLIVFMVWTVQLARRVRALEDTLARGAAAEPARAETAPEAPAQSGTAEAAAGPWAAAKAAGPVTTPPEPPRSAEPKAKAPAGPPKAIVLRAARARALAGWMRANWIYVVSAVSLGLAGVFLVQYGIEAGLISPRARVGLALAFGAALVAAGEYVRRRWGDHPAVSSAYIPSVFSAAGIVTLFAAVLSALHLYALVSPGVALAGLVAVALVAVALGWYSGPLLAALGIAGAMAAPFMVGGSSDQPELFYGYFALIALVGLAIDAVRRWAWVSVLALVLAYPAATTLYLSVGEPALFGLFLAGLVLATMAIPTMTLAPAHGGAALIESLRKGRPRGWPEFPTRLVAGAMVASVAGLVLASEHYTGGFWPAATLMALLFLAVALWAVRAPALEDLAVLPAAGLVALPVLQVIWHAQEYTLFLSVLSMEEGTPVPNTPYLLVALALGPSLAAAWRSWHGGRWPVAWGAGAALIAPAMMLAVELSWDPTILISPYAWALVAIGLAIVMTALALLFARRDGPDRPRVAGFALSATGLIAFALILVLSDAALTLALAVTVLAAAALDRRFGLRPLSAAVQAGAVLLGWRLLFDPGLGWAFDAPYLWLVLSFAGATAALAAAWWLLSPLPRPGAKSMAESGAWTFGAVLASILLARVIDDVLPGGNTDSHWFLGLLATIWLAAAANQLWRTQTGGRIRWVRRGLAALYGAVGLLVLAAAVVIFNPALEAASGNRVAGPILVNTLLLAYLVPALLFGFVAWRFAFLKRWQRGVALAVAVALAVLWAFLAIRHAWQGDGMASPGFTQPELYSYTIAMLATGAALLYQAIARRSPGLRKLAMAVIALTVAKVFLVDASGLVGLLRVFSFLALGLALAGLAFLNRWAAGQMDEDEAPAA